jgi:hypothetical protein
MTLLAQWLVVAFAPELSACVRRHDVVDDGSRRSAADAQRMLGEKLLSIFLPGGTVAAPCG